MPQFLFGFCNQFKLTSSKNQDKSNGNTLGPGFYQVIWTEGSKKLCGEGHQETILRPKYFLTPEEATSNCLSILASGKLSNAPVVDRVMGATVNVDHFVDIFVRFSSNCFMWKN